MNKNNNIFWYNDICVLFNNIDEIIPNKNLSFENKINSIARLSFLLIIIFIIFKKYYWIILSLLLLFISYYYSKNKYETFNNNNNNNNNNNKCNSSFDLSCCRKPTQNNPFMNYTLGEYIDDVEKGNIKKSIACNYDLVKDDIRKYFRNTLHTDLNDLWGKNISDRNFYTMPNTSIVNNQNEFAKWCFGDSGNCKMFGKDCLNIRDPIYNRGRYI